MTPFPLLPACLPACRPVSDLPTCLPPDERGRGCLQPCVCLTRLGSSASQRCPCAVMVLNVGPCAKPHRAYMRCGGWSRRPTQPGCDDGRWPTGRLHRKHFCRGRLKTEASPVQARSMTASASSLTPGETAKATNFITTLPHRRADQNSAPTNPQQSSPHRLAPGVPGTLPSRPRPHPPQYLSRGLVEGTCRRPR